MATFLSLSTRQQLLQQVLRIYSTYIVYDITMQNKNVARCCFTSLHIRKLKTKCSIYFNVAVVEVTTAAPTTATEATVTPATSSKKILTEISFQSHFKYIFMNGKL